MIFAKVMILQASNCPQGWGWGCLPHCMLEYHTPPRSRHPHSRPPGSRHSPGADAPPGPYTPPEQTPPEQTSPESRHPPGADTPPGIWSLLWMVSILLECILVYIWNDNQTYYLLLFHVHMPVQPLNICHGVLGPAIFSALVAMQRSSSFVELDYRCLGPYSVCGICKWQPLGPPLVYT